MKIYGAFLFGCLGSFLPGKSQEGGVHITDVQEGSAHSYYSKEFIFINFIIY